MIILVKENLSYEKVHSSNASELDIFTEKDVFRITMKYLYKNGFDIIYQGRREGPDIVAYNCSIKELLIIEIKGVPTTIKIKGRDKGKNKKKSAIKRQFWGWSGSVIIQLMEREYEWTNKSAQWVIDVIGKLKHADVLKVQFVAILGYHEKYKEILEKRKHAILRLGYKALLIDKHEDIKYKIS